MIQLLKYSFSRLYFFYGQVLSIKHNVFLYPSIVIGVLLAFNILVILSIILLIFNIGFFGMLYPAVGVGVILATILYISMGSRYKVMLKDVEGYGGDKRSKLKRKSIVYASVSIILFSWVYWLYYQGLI